tara:strand:- start:53 stop:304 length:252 start_codon:yes stop_codon:yes gene_type:complete
MVPKRRSVIRVMDSVKIKYISFNKVGSARSNPTEIPKNNFPLSTIIIIIIFIDILIFVFVVPVGIWKNLHKKLCTLLTQWKVY